MAKAATETPVPAEKQLAGFLAKYDRKIATLARAVRRAMRARLPGAVEMVYDNYNALVIGYGPTERPSEAIISIVLFPQWVTICFIRGVDLPDPRGLLNGEGNQVRHLRVASAAELGEPGIRVLINHAVKNADPGFARDAPHRLIIKSISAKQRPRRVAPR